MRLISLKVDELDQVRQAQDAQDDARELLDYCLANVTGPGGPGWVREAQEHHHSAERAYDEQLARLLKKHYKDDLGVLDVDVNYQTGNMEVSAEGEDEKDEDEP